MGFEIEFVRGAYEFVGKSVALDFVIKFFAVYLPYIIVGGALWFFLKKSWKESVYGLCFAVLALILSRGIITEFIRFFYDRERPYEDLDFAPLFVDGNPAFPSGHAATFFAIAFVVMSFNKKAGWIFVGLAILNGLGRIFAGVHWPLDVLGGALVALFSFFFVRKFIFAYRPK